MFVIMNERMNKFTDAYSHKHVDVVVHNDVPVHVDTDVDVDVDVLL